MSVLEKRKAKFLRQQKMLFVKSNLGKDLLLNPPPAEYVWSRTPKQLADMTMYLLHFHMHAKIERSIAASTPETDELHRVWTREYEKKRILLESDVMQMMMSAFVSLAGHSSPEKADFSLQIMQNVVDNEWMDGKMLKSFHPVTQKHLQ